MSDGGRNTLHVLDEQMTGDNADPPRRRGGVRSPSLKVLAQVKAYDEPSWIPLPGLPAGGRDECRTGERPCPYVRCREHLWREDGDERPGPRWRGKLGTTLVARWLERPQPPSCGLDVYEQDETLDYEVIAKAIGKTADWTRRLIARADRKFKRMLREALDDDGDGEL